MKRRILAVMLAVPVLCGAVALAWPRGGAEYKRFVSAPLRDGTRYTFLYPARYSDHSFKGGGAFLLDEARSEPTLLARIKSYTPVGRARANVGGYRSAEITVQGNTSKPKRANSRLEFKGSTLYLLSIQNARSRASFFATHTHYQGDRSRFEAERKVFSESFHILAPGAPAPAA